MKKLSFFHTPFFLFWVYSLCNEKFFIYLLITFKYLVNTFFQQNLTFH